MDLPEMMLLAEDLAFMRPKKVGHNLQSWCPFHHNKSRSFGISLDPPHAWNCFACGERGLSLDTMVMKLHKIQGKKALNYVRKFDSTYNPEIKKTLTRKKATIKISERVLYPYPTAYHPYLRGRHIRKSAVERCGLKFDKSRNMIIIPVRDFDRYLQGLVLRSVDDTIPKEYRYDNSPGPWKENSLLGAHLLPKRRDILYLVEGPFDWVRMVDAGFENTLCLLGSAMSATQQLKIKNLNYKKIMLCFDKDPAGWKCLNDCYSRLKQYCPITRLDYDKFPYEDVGKVDNIILQKLLKPVSMTKRYEKTPVS